MVPPPIASGCRTGGLCSCPNPWPRAAMWSPQLPYESLDLRMIDRLMSCCLPIFTSLCHMHKSSFPPAFPSVASVCSITLSCFKDKNLSILSQASRGFLHLQLKGYSAPLPMSPTTACKHLLRAFSIAFIFQMSSVLVRIPRASSPP